MFSCPDLPLYFCSRGGDDIWGLYIYTLYYSTYSTPYMGVNIEDDDTRMNQCMIPRCGMCMVMNAYVRMRVRSGGHIYILIYWSLLDLTTIGLLVWLQPDYRVTYIPCVEHINIPTMEEKLCLPPYRPRSYLAPPTAK